MRGQHDPQHFLFTCVSPEMWVPADHPLRTIKAYASAALRDLTATFTVMYRTAGRPSIPPERLLKSQLLIALYSVRSDRLFCETLDYNLLYRWFLDMSLEDAQFAASTFSKNRDRLLEHDVALKFFDAVVHRARREGLLSNDHFTVDGTLIEAWASLKSFRPKNESPPDTDDPGNPTVNFHGQKRSNKTHESAPDRHALLARKCAGKEARLCYSGNVLMENRHGMCVNLTLELATGMAERAGAAYMLHRQGRKGVRPGTLGGVKGYHTWDFVELCRERGIPPHIAMKKTPIKARLDRRTTRHPGYAISQRVRERVEEIFGWKKTVGGLRKTRFRGRERTRQHAHWVGAADNLLRRECAAPGTVKLELAAVRRGYRLANRLEKLRSAPYMPRLKVENVRTNFFTFGQLHELAVHLPVEIAQAARFAFLSGWRRAEIFGLEWDRVDMKAGIARLHPGMTKNGKGRMWDWGDMGILARERMRELWAVRNPGCALVVHPEGEPIKDFRGAWAKACEEIGLPGHTFHALRRLSVMTLEQAGVPRTIAMAQTGHATESTYVRCGIVGRAEQKRGSRAQGEYLNKLVGNRNR